MRADDADSDEKDTEQGPIQIDFDGIARRVTPVPVPQTTIRDLQAVDGSLLFVRGVPFYYGRDAEVDSEIKIFDLKKRELKTVTKAQGFDLSADARS